jgi:hypothetical protein
MISLYDPFDLIEVETTTDTGPRTMVQLLCLTIDGQKVICLAPVVNSPEDGIHLGRITSLEFGDVISMRDAYRLLSGDLHKHQTRQ